MAPEGVSHCIIVYEDYSLRHIEKFMVLCAALISQNTQDYYYLLVLFLVTYCDNEVFFTNDIGYFIFKLEELHFYLRTFFYSLLEYKK